MSEKDYSLTELNKPKDWTTLTDMAKKHLPIIEAPTSVNANEPFQVKLKIGGIDGGDHPNMLGHWINWVLLYADLRPIAQIYFYPTMTNNYKATLTITVEKSTTLIAQIYCNLHGVWEGKEAKVLVK